MFNDYVWQIYLNAGGKSVVEIFRKNIEENFSEEYIESIVKFRSVYCPSKAICKDTKDELAYVLEDVKHGIEILEDGNYSIESAMQSLYEYINGNDDFSAQRVFVDFSNEIEYYTTMLAIELHEIFVPYYYQMNFNVLEKIALEFGMVLPEMPIKKDYEGRFYYYGELCETFYNFRIEHNMTEYEFLAFLYDYAPNYIGGIKSYIIDELPEPKAAYFIGGGANDAFLSREPDTVTPWQCNNDTVAGDMVVMYLRTPISAVDSIWRSVSVGFNDPLFYYYRCTYIAHPTAIKRITQKELQRNEIFKNITIVKKNMQGINGVELKPSEYNHLVDISKANVPKLEFLSSSSNDEFVNERSIENFLIKPLLRKLRYSENDYLQQLHIEIGNHSHTLIPDFILLPSYTNGYYSAFAIIEAKFSINSKKQLNEAIKQARSYARQLGTKYSLIVSKEGVWLTSEKDCYSEAVFSANWEELKNPDLFRQLQKHIGK